MEGFKYLGGSYIRDDGNAYFTYYPNSREYVIYDRLGRVRYYAVTLEDAMQRARKVE